MPASDVEWVHFELWCADALPLQMSMNNIMIWVNYTYDADDDDDMRVNYFIVFQNLNGKKSN